MSLALPIIENLSANGIKHDGTTVDGLPANGSNMIANARPQP